MGVPLQRAWWILVNYAVVMLVCNIGGELGTTEKTIRVHRGRTMQKLGVQSVADLVRLVERLRAAGYMHPR